MRLPIYTLFAVAVGFTVSSCSSSKPTAHLKKIINQAAVLSPHCIQFVTDQRNIEPDDSLSNTFSEILLGQLTDYMGLHSPEQLNRPPLSPVAQRELLHSVQAIYPSFYSNRIKKKIAFSEVIRSELKQNDVRYVILFVGRGLTLTKEAYRQRINTAKRSNRSAQLLNPLLFNTTGVSLTTVDQVNQYQSLLALYVVDIERQKTLLYKRDIQGLKPVHSFTVKRHLAALFSDFVTQNDQEISAN